MKGVNFMIDEIFGITCAVKNCVHHDTNDGCTANHIKVGSFDAKSTSETKCETFECNSNCKTCD